MSDVLVSTLILLLATVLTAPASSDPARMRVDVAGVPDEPVWVGQKISLNVRVLLAEPPVGPIQFDVPEGQGGVFLQLQESPFFYSEKVDGISFTAWNHTFLFYPHRAGASRVPPMTVRAVLRGDEPLELSATTGEIRMTAKLPEGAESFRTLVATSELKVTETWSPGPPVEAKVGDAFTRTVTLTAPDVLAMGFPVPDFEASETLRVYPKAPAARDTISRGEITGRRTEKVVYICQAEGPAIIPALVYPWLKLQSGSLEKIELPAHTFAVAPNPAIQAAGATPEQEPHRALRLAVLLTLPILATLGGLGWWLGPRLGRRVDVWWEARQAAEPAVFRRLIVAIEEGNLKDYHANSRCWLQSLPGRQPATMPLFADQTGDADLPSLLGSWLASAYGASPSSGPNHGDLILALKRVRKTILLPVAGAEGLPLLNG